MQVSRSLCVSAALFTLSPPSSDSSSGVTVIMRVSQQLQVCPHTSCILLRGGIRQPLSKPTNPYSAAKPPTMSSAERWDGAAAASEQTGELIKAVSPPREVVLCSQRMPSVLGHRSETLGPSIITIEV